MERARELLTALVQTNQERFMKYSFLLPQWWLLVAFFIVPWCICFRLIHRTKRLETVFVGVFVAVITLLFDSVGYNLSFWDYPIEMIPLVPEALSFDLSMVPVALMLLYQYLDSWKSYSIGLLCMTVAYAIIGEPFCNWIGIVVYIKWKYIYSAVYYVVLGVITRWLAIFLKRDSQRVTPSKVMT
jgi:hypothetical protein